MGIEFIISNNTIVLGQRKEQSGALSRPRGPAGRGWQAGGELLGPAQGRGLGRTGLGCGSPGPRGAGGSGPPEAAGRMTRPAEAARAGRGRSPARFLFRASLCTVPRGLPEGWAFTLFGLGLQLEEQSLHLGRDRHKGHPAPPDEREGLSIPPRRPTPAPGAQSRLCSQPSPDKGAFNRPCPGAHAAQAVPTSGHATHGL